MNPLPTPPSAPDCEDGAIFRPVSARSGPAGIGGGGGGGDRRRGRAGDGEPGSAGKRAHPLAIARAAVALGLLGAVIFSTTAAAQQSIASWDYDQGATKVELTGVFEPPPPTGYLPVRVELTNGAVEKRSWQLDFASIVGWNERGMTRSSFEVAAEPGHSTSATVLVPLQAALSTGPWTYGGGQHRLEVSAAGARVERTSTSHHSQRAQTFPAIALSDALAQKSLTQLNDEVGKTAGSGFSHEKVFGSRFLPAHLPDNWLGFSGFDHVMLTTEEWLAVSPGVRTALLQAAQFGLQLHLYRANDAITLAAMGVPMTDAAATRAPQGLGSIQLTTWNGDTLEAPVTVAAFMGIRDRSLVERISKGYASGGSWGRQRALGDRSFGGWQVVVFLLVFGLLIGPINLFVLAPAGQRHKLFVTTPLISVGASLLLIGLILVQDGTGGEGRRFVAVHLPAGEAAAHVTQEQVSRTGVVVGSSFRLPHPAYLAQVVLPVSPWAKFNAGLAGQAMDVRLDGLQASGNWFQSRTVQGQFLRAIVPTRGRLERLPPATPEAAPAFVSSLDFELASFVYLDAAGGRWRAAGVVSKGRPVTLVPDTTEWPELLGRLSTQASAGLAERISDVVPAGPAFLATAAAAPGCTIETLPSIRWRDDQIVLFGSLPATP